ncbi:PstS family phosphate ABC transporter substrate-binding protein [Leptolyngbya sp. PCC 6406]|uniref:PstS family phosphate ABC transporter substrate-binding protein n=1 Tax=Leptolyngbya sp. PCC 6406 TaxID=1173264 RepID=UPI0002AC93F1|nr:PstS family phosphate ABC transporter substrate-binding protein [Leptolyngbya sp. PCC 6406]
MLSKKKFVYSLSAVVLLGSLVACGGGTDTAGTDTSTGEETADAGSDLTGNVLVDGSSTVFPISEAMAEEFMAANPGVRVTVGVSGTGGGFKKFCAGETDISNASRPIKQEEIDLCAQNGIEYVEIPVAYDGLSVVINPSNEFATCLTVDELKKMWEPAAEGTITNWNQIRPDFPDQALGLYGAGTDSGTYDYFTAAIVGEESSSRGDFTASEDDNVIVQGVAADQGGIGFFGVAYYEENADQLGLVEIDNGSGCVAPTPDTIASGEYAPLSRPEFFYVKKESLDNPAVAAFARYQIAPENAELISEVGYVPLPTEIEDLAEKRIEERIVGSVFNGESAVGLKLVDLLGKE